MPTSTEELESLVIKAQEATRKLDSAELRKVAFEQVLDHLLASCGHQEGAVPNLQASPQGTMTEPADGLLASEQQRIDTLARYFGISPEEARLVFDVSGERPGLVLESRHLPEAKAPGTRDIALLVTGALTALGQETTTSYIREAADHYNRLDSPHLMSTLVNMPEIAVLGRPGSPNRVVRMKATGAEAVKALIQQIVS